MNKALLALVIIFVIVLIVVPLMYVTLGKLKSPLEGFFDRSASGVSRTAPIGQNYVPLPASAARNDPDTARQNEGTVNFDPKIEQECAKEVVFMTEEDVHLSVGSQPVLGNPGTTTPATRIESQKFRFRWDLQGAWRVLTGKEREGGSAFQFAGGRDEKTFLIGGMQVYSRQSKACTDYFAKNFSFYHDSSRFLSDHPWDEEGFSILEKGLTVLGGEKYYWYLFKDEKWSGGKGRERDEYYVAYFETYKNGISYELVFKGANYANGSYRTFYNIAATYATGLAI